MRYTMNPDIATGLALVHRGIEQLASAHSSRRFTIDGRLVGDIGETIAAVDYNVVIDRVSRHHHDGITPDGRLVQVKATFQDKITIRTIPELLLAFRLHNNGTYEEVFNGPGSLLTPRYGHRKHFGMKQLGIPIAVLREIISGVPAADRVARR